jgi:hypothetical protein
MLKPQGKVIKFMSAKLQQQYTYLPPTVERYYNGIEKSNFYWPRINAAINTAVQACKVGQKRRITTVKKYGKLPLPAHHKMAPWEEVHVDLICSWDICYNSTLIPDKSTVEIIRALTIIDKPIHHHQSSPQWNSRDQSLKFH